MSSLKRRRYRKRWEEGCFHGGDPRKFRPDEEGCTPEELASWRAACEARKSQPSQGCRSVGAGVTVCGGPWGLGTYRYAVRERGNPRLRRLVNQAAVTATWISWGLGDFGRQPKVKRGQRR